MTFCFLDPVFFTLNSEFTLKHFKSEIFPVLSELEEKISEIEENLRERKVFFNICQEIIYDAMNFNPFQFETNDSVKIYFERFLLKFLENPTKAIIKTIIAIPIIWTRPTV